jgi:carnitine-CoA ligase
MARAQGPLELLIRQRVADHPDTSWLKWKDTAYSWRESLSNIQRAASGLLDLGVRPGERVAIMMANRPEFLWTHFAVLFIGAVSVPVNISQRGPALAHILRDSGAAAIVFEAGLRDVVGAVRGDLPGLRRTVVYGGRPGGDVDWDFDRLMSGADAEPGVEAGVEVPEGGGTSVMYTSGTTGPPKGVVSTGSDPAALGEILAATGVRPGETMYTSLPLFHGNALWVSAAGSITLDARLALGERFSASRFWDECRRHEAVEFNTLGGMVSILLKQPGRPDDRDHLVRTVLSAGCPENRWREFEDRFGVRIVEWFGMVDSPGFLLNAEGRVGAMGRPVAGIEFAVVDTRGRRLGPGEVGELVFRHPAGRLTYYENQPEATERAYRGGWFHSGDLAECDADGYFRYRGRKKESIRRLGENISAWEIESVVNTHPKVRDSAAHAVPSDLGEDEVKVTVVAQPGAEPTPEEILAFCRGRMARHAVPRYVEFVGALPKTGTQRNRYAALRARGVTPQTWDRVAAGYEVRDA